MTVGSVYLASMVYLVVVVAAVYSAAQEAYAPPQRVAREALRRGTKLAGVLAGLALIVTLLSRF